MLPKKWTSGDHGNHQQFWLFLLQCLGPTATPGRSFSTVHRIQTYKRLIQTKVDKSRCKVPFQQSCETHVEKAFSSFVILGKDKRCCPLIVNPLSPNINMHALFSVLHISLVVLVGRISLNIKSFYLS